MLKVKNLMCGLSSICFSKIVVPTLSNSSSSSSSPSCDYKNTDNLNVTLKDNTIINFPKPPTKITYYNNGMLKSMKYTVFRFNGDDNLVNVLHSENDNPAKIQFIHTKSVHNENYNDISEANICRLTWYHYGQIYRKQDPKLPADMGFYSDGQKWYESYYNEFGKLHCPSDDKPSFVSYYYSLDNNKVINEERWHNNGVLQKKKHYDWNGREEDLKHYHILS